jgi:hypothetical protein
MYIHCETQREFINNICILQEPVEPRRSLEKVFLLTDGKINLFLLKYIPVAKFIVVDWGRLS